MTQFNPDWKVTINGVDYTNTTISRVSHRAGRRDIYSQPTASNVQIQLVALQNQTFNISINDGLTLQIKNTSGTYVNLFGGNITDIGVQVASTGSIGNTIVYTLIAMGSLAKLNKIITTGVLASDYDGDQIDALISQYLVSDWNGLSAAVSWATYSATETWATAANIGLGEIDRPGQYELVNRASNEATIISIANEIANSAFGYLYEDSVGNIGYADANHRQDYLLANGYTEVSANTAIGAGLSTLTKAGDIRNSVAINYGNNFGSQKTASSAASIATYGYKAETFNSLIKGATDAQDVANKYISLRAYPYAAFDSITFPITSPEMDDTDRNALLNIFIGQPISITDLPTQINGGQFQGYVEGWSWTTSLNQLLLTINLSPIQFSQFAMRWNTVPIGESWNTLSATLDWLNATIVA
jgi:hypothetical protein